MARADLVGLPAWKLELAAEPWGTSDLDSIHPYQKALSEAYAQMIDEQMMELYSPRVQGWRAGWWYMRRFGIRAWATWELLGRPRNIFKGDNRGCPLYTCPMKGVPKPVNPTQCYSLFPDLPNGGTRARVLSPHQINRFFRLKGEK